MKTHYQLLELDPTASAEEIKHAFRREIARYHPDKVQHLGREFQEIAAVRAAELTEAYRILMDATSRQKYDDALADGSYGPPTVPPPAPPAAARESAPAPRQPASTDPQPPPGSDRRFQQERATTVDFVRKAAMAKLRSAIAGIGGSAAPLNVPGFDASYDVKAKKALFKKPDPSVRLLARVVAYVDAAAIEETWSLAAKSGAFDGVVSVLLLGSGVGSARELSLAISERRRRTRAGVPVLVPVDIRDWEALFPPETPEVVRQIVQRLRADS